MLLKRLEADGLVQVLKYNSLKTIFNLQKSKWSGCSKFVYISNSFKFIDFKIQKGDEIITTPMTFCSTINSIIHAGGTPVLADIEPDTWNISPVEIEKKLHPKQKAIVIVHFAWALM